MHIKNDVEHCNAYALYLQQVLLEIIGFESLGKNGVYVHHHGDTLQILHSAY
jgi:hypothetical protein